ncbi:RecQ family ATP-dependent DNA helicase [Nafulsella turpanensis]|uniref:RecQ family ATP-dependent DNA helicase n=1 Tax=Nafulsella turpanensis TaxID=1265690 RepID=UPI00034916F5|nr:ATP-dependent DNA helicase RecQ [Nafulsella turpanensis]
MVKPVEILQKVWGYSTFRPLQEEIVQAVLEGKDVLALLPTGGGKSVCFQVPALAMEGICIVVSPLIALMKDQVEQLKKRGIAATAVYSGMSKREIDITLDNCIYGQVKFLYVSPERLKTELMQARVKQMNVCLLAIDEAHCISQWGYDFRPSYLEIATFREMLPGVNCIALTATATKRVAKDIQERLSFSPKAEVFRKSFARENLSYNVRYEENKEAKLLEMLHKVPGTAVIYARSRKRCQLVAWELRKQGISADYYHAGLSNEERNYRQEAWLKNKIRVIVATNAFGMGIDKPDVRLVAHLDLPDTLEAYYQEAGRAGRDEKKAYGVVLYQTKDIEELEERAQLQFPALEEIRRVYQALANYFKIAIGSSLLTSYDFEIDDFCKTYQLHPLQTWYCIKKLEEEGFIQLTESFYAPSKVLFLLNSQEVYAFQIANAALEPLIKALLRLCGGEIFSVFTKISESAIATLLKVSVAEVKRKLDMLHKMEVIEYEQQKDSPQLTFITPRFDAARLPLQQKKLEERKAIYLQKVASVKKYIENTERCRTQMLLAYFDEHDYENCGVCDNCIKGKHPGHWEEAEMFRMRQQIYTALKIKPFPVDELVKSLKLKQRQEQLLLHTIRLMLDEESLHYTVTGQLALK